MQGAENNNAEIFVFPHVLIYLLSIKAGFLLRITPTIRECRTGGLAESRTIRAKQRLVKIDHDSYGIIDPNVLGFIGSVGDCAGTRLEQWSGAEAEFEGVQRVLSVFSSALPEN